MMSAYSKKQREPVDYIFGSRRKDRLFAADTLMAAITEGYYRTRQGVEVDIRDAVNKSVEGSELISLTQLEDIKA